MAWGVVILIGDEDEDDDLGGGNDDDDGYLGGWGEDGLGSGHPHR